MRIVVKKVHPLKRPAESVEKRKKFQASICMGLLAPGIGFGDYYAFSVMKQVLSGMGSRLFIYIYSKELAKFGKKLKKVERYGL